MLSKLSIIELSNNVKCEETNPKDKSPIRKDLARNIEELEVLGIKKNVINFCKQISRRYKEKIGKYLENFVKSNLRGNLIVLITLFQDAGQSRLNNQFINILDEMQKLNRTKKAKSSVLQINTSKTHSLEKEIRHK